MTVPPLPPDSPSPTTTVVFLSAGRSPYLSQSIARVLGGRRRPDRIELIWSGPGRDLPSVPAEVKVHPIPVSSFNHGGTRQLALDRCETELLVFLTDDAVPSSSGWLAALCHPFEDPGTGSVYGRQIARANAPLFERVFRSAKYPATGFELRSGDSDRVASGLGPVSNANAAYRVAVVRSLGGFPQPALFGEDIAVAVAALRAGWRIHYVSDAAVWHSHSLNRRQMFNRGRHAGLVRPAVKNGPAGRGASGAAVSLVRVMLREAWRQFGVAGVLAVLEGVGARAVGYAVGRVVARSAEDDKGAVPIR